MKKILSILFFLCLAITKGWAYKWTDANGVKWYFEQYSCTINGESQSLWAIYYAEGYGQTITFPTTVYKDGEACTVEAITDYSGYIDGVYRNFLIPNGSDVTLPATIKYIGRYVFSSNFTAGTIKLNATTPPTLYNNSTGVFGSDVTILVPDGCLGTYHNATPWSDIAVRVISQSVKHTWNVNTIAEDTWSGLETAIDHENMEDVMSLTINGSINSYDLVVLRNKMFNLHHLDLTNATFKASSHVFYKDGNNSYVTSDNIVAAAAFCNQHKLLSVKLPTSVSSVGASAFANCAGLQTVEVQSKLETIDNNAFNYCINMKEVKLPANGALKSIGGRAFYECNALSSISLPASLQTIGNYAFDGCKNLISVNFAENNSLQTIGIYAFAGCSSLTSVKFPDNGSLNTIGDNAFGSCTSLTSVKLPNNGSLQTIGSEAFYYCDALTSINIPEGITTIAKGTFAYCSSLKTISLPSTLTSIEGGYYGNNGAFGYCSSLTSISLPIKLTTIGQNAFYSSGLTELHLPAAIRSIGKYAFANCSNLKNYYIYTVEPTTVENNTFSNYTTATLHVPSLAWRKYYLNTNWSFFPEPIEDNEYQYRYFYLTRDLDINDNSLTNLGSQPEVELEGTSGMIVNLSSGKTVSLGDIHMSNEASIVVAGGNITAEAIYLEMPVTKGKWYFLSLPHRVKMTNVEAPGKYVFRYYDGAERATNGSGGWKNYTGTYLQPKQGYIFQANTDGTLKMKVEKADLNLGGGTREDALTTYTATNAQNASWNFVGNPHTSYFDIDETGYTAPITVWTGTTYQAYRAGDDPYHLSPMQGFFVQKPSTTSKMNFPASGCHTSNQWADIVAAKQAAARTRGADNRRFVDLTIGDGETTNDQTRVVFNPVKGQNYEMDCDAAKFMSELPVAQLWTVGSDQAQYAINERPEGEVALAYTAATAGMLCISAERMDQPVWLYDRQEDVTHDLSVGGYLFSTTAGTFEGRFVLLTAPNPTAIDKVEAQDGKETTTYTLDGRQLPQGSQPRGAYIVKQGNKAVKVIKK